LRFCFAFFGVNEWSRFIDSRYAAFDASNATLLGGSRFFHLVDPYGYSIDGVLNGGLHFPAHHFLHFADDLQQSSRRLRAGALQDRE